MAQIREANQIGGEDGTQAAPAETEKEVKGRRDANARIALPGAGNTRRADGSD